MLLRRISTPLWNWVLDTVSLTSQFGRCPWTTTVANEWLAIAMGVSVSSYIVPYLDTNWFLSSHSSCSTLSDSVSLQTLLSILRLMMNMLHRYHLVYCRRMAREGGVWCDLQGVGFAHSSFGQACQGGQAGQEEWSWILQSKVWQVRFDLSANDHDSMRVRSKTQIVANTLRKSNVSNVYMSNIYCTTKLKTTTWEMTWLPNILSNHPRPHIPAPFADSFLSLFSANSLDNPDFLVFVFFFATSVVAEVDPA